MNAELYYCQLSDLIISKKESTILTSDRQIKNLLVEEALLAQDYFFQPLPWTQYTKHEVNDFLSQLKLNKWIQLDHIEDEFLVKIKHEYRLKTLINFIGSQNKTWKLFKSKESAAWRINSGSKIVLNSFSTTETQLIIPHRLITCSREIALPNNYCLLIDPYFQDKYSEAIFLWIKLMTEKSNDVELSSSQINECLELLKAVLQDIGNNYVGISNDVKSFHAENTDYLMDKANTFYFVLDYKAGLSIQLLEKKDNKSQSHIRNLDLDCAKILNNPDEWTNLLRDLIQMHMHDIKLQINLNNL
tara:strand:+ start:8431 stop:9336 length:906 start_codon:yes stop_codon:yes gene_type:complete